MPTKTTTRKSPRKIALRAPKVCRRAPKKAPKKSTKATKAVKQPAKRSHLELRWIREWERQGGPELVEEFMFHPTRRWRADFAHIESKLLIEIEGGAYGGRHTRGKGFVEDLDKYASAWLHGYTVLRIGAHQVKSHVIRAVIGRIRGGEENSPESLPDSPESTHWPAEESPAWSGRAAPGAPDWLKAPIDEAGGGVGGVAW